MKKSLIFVYILVFIGIAWYAKTVKKSSQYRHTGKAKIYWFIPDGLRSEKDVFKIYEWAKDGYLPNLKKLMAEGSYGYSRPVFPSHTPVNYATLLTGATPDIHGVADGAMRTTGYPLSMVSKGGFSSVAKKVPSIWSLFEDDGRIVSLLSVPGSTPPELSKGFTIKGRWGGWGVEFPSIIFHSRNDSFLRNEIGQNKRVFTFGSDLTKFIPAKEPTQDWNKDLLKSFSAAREVDLTNWGFPLFGLIVDSTDDKKVNYDHVIFSTDKKSVLINLDEQSWSEWLPATLNWQTKNDYNINTPKKNKWERDLSAISVKSFFKIRVIKLGGKDFFRIRIIYDNLNEFITAPLWLAGNLEKKIGPMVDFVDNYPPQLIYFDEDKQVFLEEAKQSWDWHTRSVSYLMNDLKSDLVIHSIYNPNQMLTSRWWLPFLDPLSPTYKTVSEAHRAQLWSEVKEMYKRVDDILGEIMKNAEPDTYIVFSSDHGALPLYKEVLLNNLFAKKGWLKFKYNNLLEQNEVDWEKSKVVFIQMNNIYINPKGLGGIYNRTHGADYEKLRNEVIATLESLKDPETGVTVLDHIWPWEKLGEIHLPADRVGDLVIANKPPYLWTEDMTQNLELFKKSFKGGFKQAVMSDNPGLLTPFVIKGPGIKANYEIKDVINHVDQFATIMKVSDMKAPAYTAGKVITEIIITK